MVFSSLTFLFAFLPVVLLLHFLVPRGARNALLCLASLAFYAWGEGVYVGLMLLAVALNHAGGLLIARARAGARARTARNVLALFVAADLLLIGVFKYATFVLDNLGALLGTSFELEPIHLPIGISFYTFQALSYLVDVYRGDTPVQRNPLHVALYVALFPQLIAGPIVRYQDVARQIVERTLDRQGFARGVRRFVLGLAKKVLIANVLAGCADRVFAFSPAELSPAIAWLGVTAYAFQIYFDFSGYSDMAIGLGWMFGFHFLENFRHPYAARSVRDFWRRWHISLSTWFRDYVYVSLGGSRGGTLRTYRNLVVVFLLCGLWHGASWNFVLWGGLHGGFLVVERVGLGAWLERLPALFARAYTLFVVWIGWVLFRSETLGATGDMLAALFGRSGVEAIPLASVLERELALTLLVATLAALPIVPALARRLTDAHGNLRGAPLAALRGGALVVLFAATLLYLTAGTYNPFIYFRF